MLSTNNNSKQCQGFLQINYKLIRNEPDLSALLAVCYCEHIFQFITIPFPFYGDTIGFMMFFVLLGLCRHFFTVGTNTPCSGKRFKK